MASEKTIFDIEVDTNYRCQTDEQRAELVKRLTEAIEEMCSREVIPNTVLFIKEGYKNGFDNIKKIKPLFRIQRGNGSVSGRLTIQVLHNTDFNLKPMNRSIKEYLKNKMPIELKRLHIWITTSEVMNVNSNKKNDNKKE